jgi:transposase
MQKKTKKAHPIYSESFKFGVISRVVSGQLTKQQAQRKYGIGGKSTILEWMRSYGYGTDPQPHSPMAKSSDKSRESDPKNKRIKQLEKQLENERIRSEFYKTIIDVAERELGISIRKKSNTNPSD